MRHVRNKTGRNVSNMRIRVSETATLFNNRRLAADSSHVDVDSHLNPVNG